MDAVIFDADGTLCDVSGIRHFVRGPERNFHKFHSASVDCPPVRVVQGLWHAMPNVAKIVVTARSRIFEHHTVWWLLLNGFEPDDLFMRDPWDFRPDFEVKRDMLVDIRQRWNPVLAIDDNPAVCALWAQEQIPFVQIPGWED